MADDLGELEFTEDAFPSVIGDVTSIVINEDAIADATYQQWLAELFPSGGNGGENTGGENNEGSIGGENTRAVPEPTTTTANVMLASAGLAFVRKVA